MAKKPDDSPALRGIKPKEAEYEPYGKEWEKEILKHTKIELIDFIRRIGKKQDGYIRKDIADKQKGEAYGKGYDEGYGKGYDFAKESYESY